VFPAAELIGVDPAPDMVRQAEASASTGTRFVNAVAEELPFADAIFDLVVSTMSFHHWSSQPAGLAEVPRVLAPGAVLALTDALAVGRPCASSSGWPAGAVASTPRRSSTRCSPPRGCRPSIAERFRGWAAASRWWSAAGSALCIGAMTRPHREVVGRARVV
jgi:ubiquinone/menaquinone biosynthesis C-methylase UbiE